MDEPIDLSLLVDPTLWPNKNLEGVKVDYTKQEKGPASELSMDDWCIDCGHHKSLHNLNPHERICKYWTDLCECKGFVSRSEALKAVRES